MSGLGHSAQTNLEPSLNLFLSCFWAAAVSIGIFHPMLSEILSCCLRRLKCCDPNTRNVVVNIMSPPLFMLLTC